MSLRITEKWIRERVGLQNDNLEDVKSVSLPGTYQEKITHLGNSLQSFIRLRQLDLSRNALQSLEGLQYLEMLEKLNLYYNNIVNLKDLYQLRHNINLQELDLRLNPVTNNEPDYRLFVVHMLPNLRLLDDRTVRDSERRAALMHFDSDQAAEMTVHHGHSRLPSRETAHTRSEQISKLAGNPTVVGEEDNDLFDLITRIDDELSLSGQRSKGVSYQSHAKDDILDMNHNHQSSASQHEPPHKQHDPPHKQHDRGYHQSSASQHGPPHKQHDRGYHHEVDDRCTPPLGDTEEWQQLPVSKNDHHSKVTNGNSSKLNHGKGLLNSQNEDENLKFTDEADAYYAFKVNGHFTPNPKLGEVKDNWQCGEDGRGQSDYVFKDPPSVQRMFEPSEVHESNGGSAKQNMSGQQGLKQHCREDVNQLLNDLLNLVDRYWNGSKSLHFHSKFQAQAHDLLNQAFLENRAVASVEQTSLKDALRKLDEKNKILQRMADQTKKAGENLQKNLEDALDQAQKDVESLQQRLQSSIAENHKLAQQLKEAKETSIKLMPSVTSSNQSSVVDEEIMKEVEAMRQENDRLRLQIKHFVQLQELATMLQESHKSLVTTNDHLLKELNEMKLHHKQEVKQLHWSYEELKRTIDMYPQNGHMGSS